MGGVTASYKCEDCGHWDIKVEPIKTSNGVLQIQTTCRKCANKSFLAQNKTNDEWRMPFGKYKGKTISEIAEENIGYIEWGSKNLPANIAERFEAEL